MNTTVTLRPATWDDLDAVLELINREGVAINGEERLTRSDLEHEWKEPGFSLETDSCIALLPDKSAAAYADYANTREPYARPYAFCALDPDRGSQTDPVELVRWAVDRATSDIPKAPPEARMTLIAPENERNPTVLDAWAAEGFTEGRRFYQMRIAFDGPPQPATVPEEYAIRPLEQVEQWDAFLAMQEAFRDHYGFTQPPSLEKAFETWKHHLIESNGIDPDMLLVAIGPEGTIAGGSLCRPTNGSREDMGWVNSLAVRPAHRRRGLAEALLRRSFEVFHAKGKTGAGLGVDADSLTNATRLYEKCGMHRHEVYVQMQKVIREGRELANMG